MKNTLPENTLAALEFLVRTAKADKVSIAGFAFVDTDTHLAMMCYGDQRYAHNPEFYKEACLVTEKKMEQGNTVVHNLGEVV